VKSKYESQNLTGKIVPETESVALPKTCSERVVGNPHFARHLRAKLLRRACPTVREILDTLDDAQLVEMFLRNEQQGRDHLAKTRVKKQADKVNHLMRRAEKEIE
jgi:hypothetical protein